MNIYFSGSIRGGRDDVDIYNRIISYLKKYGNVLTEHIGDNSLNTLLHLKFNSTIYADRGIHGKGKNQRGSNGNHTEIRVPLGTVIRKRDSNGSEATLC